MITGKDEDYKVKVHREETRTKTITYTQSERLTDPKLPKQIKL